LFDAAGYHVKNDSVYYLNAFPGKAFEISGADAGSFTAFDTTYARDKANVYVNGEPLRGADAASFEVLPPPASPKTVSTYTNESGRSATTRPTSN
jgi:DKNYY family